MTTDESSKKSLHLGFIGAMGGGGIGASLSTGWPIEVAIGVGVVQALLAIGVIVVLWMAKLTLQSFTGGVYRG